MPETTYTAARDTALSRTVPEYEPAVNAAMSALASRQAQQGQARDINSTSGPSSSGDGTAPQSTAPQSTPAPSTAPQGGAGGQSTAPTPGSATVVGAAADSEYAFDNSFTPALVAALQANPNLSIDEVLANLASGNLGAPATDNDGGLHHPTIVQYGQTDENTTTTVENQKRAVLVPNQNYTNINPLGTPIAEANSISSQLTARGYDATVHPDQTAAQMGTLWNGMVNAANEGDDLVAFYGGHGAPEGLIGINDGFPPLPRDFFANGAVESVVSAATARGAHIRFVMDSCHSGAAVEAVRQERENELASESDGIEDAVRVTTLEGLSHAKQMLIDHVEARAAALDPLDQAIAQHQSNPPPPGNLIADAQYQLILAGLQGARAGVVAYYDAQADALWSLMSLVLSAARRLAGHPDSPPAITDYRTLGGQINYLDDMWNTVSRPMERDLAEQQGGS